MKGRTDLATEAMVYVVTERVAKEKRKGGKQVKSEKMFVSLDDGHVELQGATESTESHAEKQNRGTRDVRGLRSTPRDALSPYRSRLAPRVYFLYHQSTNSCGFK